MPRTVTNTIYQFDELTEPAKEQARNWHRSTFDPDLSDTLDDIITMGNILGIEFRSRKDCRWQIPFRFVFTGVYRFNPSALEDITAAAPLDGVLHEIADDLVVAQGDDPEPLWAQITHSAESLIIDTDVSEDRYQLLKGALKDFTKWAVGQLTQEADYQSSNEYVDDFIRSNEFEFFNNGRVW